MHKFTSKLNSINESKSLLVESEEDFIKFGKNICYQILHENYNDEVVENYLNNLYKSSSSIYEALDKFDKHTMSQRELSKYAIQSANGLLEEFKSNPGAIGLVNRLSELSSKYPVFVNEHFLQNFAVLLERLDFSGEYHSNINENRSKLPLATYEPKTINEAAEAIKTTYSFIDDFIKRYSSNAAPEIIAASTNTLGLGGFDIDFVKFADNQVKKAIKLRTEADNQLNLAQNITAKDKEIRSVTLEWFRAFMNDAYERYDFNASKIANNGIDIDLFVKWGMDQFVGMIWQNKEFLLKNFYNNKFTYIKKAYRDYLTYCGITEDVFEPAALDKDDLLNFYRIESYAKMYELCDLVHELASYQEIWKSKLVNTFISIVKPMVDSLRIDKEILAQRTLIRYQ